MTIRRPVRRRPQSAATQQPQPTTQQAAPEQPAAVEPEALSAEEEAAKKEKEEKRKDFIKKSKVPAILVGIGLTIMAYGAIRAQFDNMKLENKQEADRRLLWNQRISKLSAQFNPFAVKKITESKGDVGLNEVMAHRKKFPIEKEDAPLPPRTAFFQMPYTSDKGCPSLIMGRVDVKEIQSQKEKDLLPSSIVKESKAESKMYLYDLVPDEAKDLDKVRFVVVTTDGGISGIYRLEKGAKTAPQNLFRAAAHRPGAKTAPTANSAKTNG